MTTAKVTRDRCENEDDRGVRCAFGPGHRCPCSFKPYRPSAAQVATLEEIAGVKGVRKFQNIGSSKTAPLKALSQRGFIGLRYVNSRAWDAWLTPAGQRVLIDLPR